MTTFSFQGHSFRFSRYTAADNNSLKAWNAGDEYLLQKIEEIIAENSSIAIYNDRFGFLSSVLHQHEPITIVQYKSQQKALEGNFKENGLELKESLVFHPLEFFSKPIDIACIKVPKSAALFELYLLQLLPNLQEDGVVMASFMTRHFSKKIIKVAEKYFEEVEQSRAWKKSRLLVLKKKKKVILEKEITKTIPLDENHTLEQYLGIFSGQQIDLATRYLLQFLHLTDNEQKVLDLASGNGVIAYHLRPFWILK